MSVEESMLRACPSRWWGCGGRQVGDDFERGQEDIWLKVAIEPDREADHSNIRTGYTVDFQPESR